MGKRSKGLNVAVWRACGGFAHVHAAWIGVVRLWSPPADPLVAADETDELENFV